MSETVFVTGSTGFVGHHVAMALRDAGHEVRALVRDGTATRLPQGCTPVRGDLRRAGELVPALRGCRYLVHVAGAYSFHPRERDLLRRVNVDGCRGLLAAAHLAGLERAVVTSSSSTVGPMRDGVPATEESAGQGDDHRSAYHASKLDQERVALAARLPVVLVLPTAPVGERDLRPTPTGEMVVTFLRGRMVGVVDGGMNVVDVRDVARAHVAALQRGRDRVRYLVGGENLSFAELFGVLAEVSGRPRPRRRIPYAVALAAGLADEARCRLLPASRPAVPLEGVRMSRHRMFVDDTRARAELGHRPSPVAPALERAVRWYREHGYAA